MYICVCQGITEGQIRKEVCKGANSLEDLTQRLGVANNCGQCGQEAREVIKKSLSEQQNKDKM